MLLNDFGCFSRRSVRPRDRHGASCAREIRMRCRTSVTCLLALVLGASTPSADRPATQPTSAPRRSATAPQQRTLEQLRAAAQSGDEVAANDLGEAYEYGDRVNVDLVEAARRRRSHGSAKPRTWAMPEGCIASVMRITSRSEWRGTTLRPMPGTARPRSKSVRGRSRRWEPVTRMAGPPRPKLRRPHREQHQPVRRVRV